MATDTWTDAGTGRKFFLDSPADLRDEEDVTFLLNLHGGGSSGQWQHDYFPAKDFVEAYRLVVASPSAATTEPARRWVAEADDEHLRNIVGMVFDRFGRSIRAFWLVGHSQGGMTSNRLLNETWWSERVDGWLSLSGGRIGRPERSPNAGPPRRAGDPVRARLEPPPTPDADFSFIYAVGEHEIAALPETSPWADKYGAGPRRRLPDVVDTEPGQTWDPRWGEAGTKEWGLQPRPGTAEVYVFPDASGGRVIADVVRLDKGHTEGLEPKVTEQILKLLVSAPGGKALVK